MEARHRLRFRGAGGWLPLISVLATLALCLSTVPPARCQSRLTAGERDAFLIPQNAVRRTHSSAELVWDDALASVAQTYVDGCPTTIKNDGTYGENMCLGFIDINKCVSAWISEKANYSCAANACAGGDRLACGHYTQILWFEVFRLSWPQCVDLLVVDATLYPRSPFAATCARARDVSLLLFLSLTADEADWVRLWA